MLRSSLLALLLIALVSPSLSLKCFKCTDCEKNTPKEQECSTTLGVIMTPICQKVVAHDKVAKGCSSKMICKAAAKLAKQAAKAVDTHGAMTYCCEGDLCNGAPAPFAGLGLLLAPALAYLAA